MNVAIVSYKGGVGKTTVVANLAATVRQIMKDVNVIDLDDQNALRLHFGVAPGISHGIACWNSLDKWQRARFESKCGVSVFPHGKLSISQKLDFHKALVNRPGLLSHWASQSFKRNRSLLLIDTPPGENPPVHQAILAADIVLIVCNTDGASFATLGMIESVINDLKPELLANNRVHYLLNNYDESKSLDRAVVAAVRKRCGGRCAPIMIHADYSVREAMASGKTLPEYAPSSQVCKELKDLSRWLMNCCGKAL